MKRTFWVPFFMISIVLGLIITGCTTQSSYSSGDTPSESAVTLPTNTLTSTTTPQPTNTPVPTPTPTIALPVRMKTPIPDLELPIIELGNVQGLVEIARWGRPMRLGCQELYPGSDSFIFVDLEGVSIGNKGSEEMKTVVNKPLSFKSGIFNMNGSFPGAISSADGKKIVVLTEEKKVQIYNELNDMVYSLDVPERMLLEFDEFDYIKSVSISFSTDGKILSITNPECDSKSPEKCMIQLIDWEKNEILTSIPGQNAYFTPGGKYLVVFTDTTPEQMRRDDSPPFEIKTDFYNVQNWESVFSMSIDWSDVVLVSPKDNYFALFESEKKVDIYRTEDFRTYLSISDFEGRIGTSVIFSSDEKSIHVIGADGYGYPPFVKTFDLSSGALISDDFSELECPRFKDRNAFADYQGILSAIFSETLLEDSGITIDWKNRNIKFGENDELTGWIDSLWNEKVFITNPIDDDVSWWYRVSGVLDLKSGKYVEFNRPELKFDQWRSIYLSKGTRWLVFEIWDRNTTPPTSNLLVFDSESNQIIAEREIEHTDENIFYPLEKFNGVGYLGKENCTKFIGLGENVEGPDEVCFTFDSAPSRYSARGKEFINSVATGSDGELVFFGTTQGNLVILDTDSGEYSIVRLNDAPIGDIAISLDGTMISTYSYNDYFQVWGVLE